MMPRMERAYSGVGTGLENIAMPSWGIPPPSAIPTNQYHNAYQHPQPHHFQHPHTTATLPPFLHQPLASHPPSNTTYNSDHAVSHPTFQSVSKPLMHIPRSPENKLQIARYVFWM